MQTHQKPNVASALLAIPGVWLLGVRAVPLRDGTAKTDKVIQLSTSEPKYFAKLTPLQCSMNPELIVLPDHEPPKKETAAETVARLKAELAKAEAAEKIEAKEAKAAERAEGEKPKAAARGKPEAAES